MDLYSARELALSLMDEHGILDKWTFDYDRSKRRFGCCKHGRKVISLSYHLVSLNTEDRVKDTILHEIAHALAGPRAGHGPEWRKVARLIGCTAQRCYGAEVAAPKPLFRGTCAKGCVSIKRHRRRRLICRLCHNYLIWTINRE